MAKAQPKLEVVTPVGMRVLIRRDEAKSQTKAGIHLPDTIKIPTLNGRVLAVSAQVERDEDFPEIRPYVRVIFNPGRQIPTDFEDGKLVIIPVEDVVAVLNKEEQPCSEQGASTT